MNLGCPCISQWKNWLSRYFVVNQDGIMYFTSEQVGICNLLTCYAYMMLEMTCKNQSRYIPMQLLYWIKYYLIRFVMFLRYTYKSLLFLLTRGRFSKVCLVFVISWYNFFRSLFIYLSASRIKSYFIKILSYTIAIGFVIQCLHMLNKTNYIYIQVEQLKLIK